MIALFAAVFVALYVGHMVADHVAQTDFQAAHKADSTKALVRGEHLTDREWKQARRIVRWTAIAAMNGHLCSYALCQIVALAGLALLQGSLGLSGWGVLFGLGFSVGTHGFIDRRRPVKWLLEHTGSRAFAKLGSPDGPQVGLNGPYLTDQALHIGCLFISALIIAAAGGAA